MYELKWNWKFSCAICVRKERITLTLQKSRYFAFVKYSAIVSSPDEKKKLRAVCLVPRRQGEEKLFCKLNGVRCRVIKSRQPLILEDILSIFRLN